MKTKILLLASTILMALNIQAQAPEKFNYQGIARDNTGAPLANQNLGIQISITDGTTAEYVERHVTTTNGFGLYTLQIGDGTIVSGTFGAVNWAAGNKFVKVEIDPNGGTSYTDLGTTELLSVPYALYAAEAPSSGGPPTGAAGGDLTGNYPNPAIASNAVTSGKIDNGEVKTADLDNDAVTASKIDDMGATNGEVLKWNGTDWAPATDIQGTTGTTYTAGTGIGISGTNEISADLGTDISTAEIQNNAVISSKIDNGTIITADLANNSVTSGKIDNGTVATVDLDNDAVTAAKIDPMGATNGQVLKFDGTDWAPASDDPGAAGWELSGNTATATDFIGTTNNEALRFKQNSFPAGFIDGDNTALGLNTLSANTTGFHNTAIGVEAMVSNTTGEVNTAIGRRALFQNDVGIANTAVGSISMISNTSGDFNTALGQGSLNSNSTGSSNTAIGLGTLSGNTTGNLNTAIGTNALFVSTTASSNTAVGFQSLFFNIADSLTAVGAKAMFSNTDGNHNTAIGTGALYSNVHSPSNTAIGFKALHMATGYLSPTSGYIGGNTAIGAYALPSNTTGTSNVAVGNRTLKKNTTGSYNIALGSFSLYNNTTGGGNTSIGFFAMVDNTSGNANTSVGDLALQENTTGDDNSAFGQQALGDNTTGNGNTAIGTGSMYDFGVDITGNYNTALGYDSMENISSGDYNTVIGSKADITSGSLTNASAIGAMAEVAQSNSLVLGSINGVNGATSDTKVGIGTTSPSDALHLVHQGSASTANLDGLTIEHGSPLANNWTFHVGSSSGDLYMFANGVEQGIFDATSGSYTATSDARLKKNLSSLENVLPKVMQLKPLTYQFKRQEDETRYLGFIAQEVEKIFPSIAKAPNPKDSSKYYTMNYADFGVVAIKAIQEQQKMIEEGKKERKQLKQIIEQLQQKIAELERKVK